MDTVDRLETKDRIGRSRRPPRERLLALAVHPVTLLPLMADGDEQRTCGGCARAYVRRSGDRTFVKCARTGGRRHGPDVPADLPACTAFAPRGASPDPYAALAPGIPAPPAAREPVEPSRGHGRAPRCRGCPAACVYERRGVGFGRL